jgi:hypothetical protein
MKELLDKFGLTEFLAHICPGSIALSALVLWMNPTFLDKLFAKIAANSVVSTALLLMAAYAVGLTLAVLSVVGEESFNATSVPEFRRLGSVRAFGKFLAWLWLWINHGFPKLPDGDRANDDMMLARTEVMAALDSFPARDLFSLMQYTSDQLLFFRTLFQDRHKDRAAVTLNLAETVHRRILFALGVSQSLLVWTALASLRLAASIVLWLWKLWSLPATARWVITPGILFSVGLVLSAVAIWQYLVKGPYASLLSIVATAIVFIALCAFGRPFIQELDTTLAWLALFTIGALTLLASFRLRNVANRWRRHELILTYSLTGWMY